MTTGTIDETERCRECGEPLLDGPWQRCVICAGGFCDQQCTDAHLCDAEEAILDGEEDE